MTPQLKIHVDGVGSVSRTAERGVLHINVTAAFSAQADASSNVHATTEDLTQRFRALATKTDDGAVHPSAGITTFSASAMTSSSFIPNGPDGQRLGHNDRKYTATTIFQVVFRDLHLLADIATELAGRPYVSITRTEWRLTEATKSGMEPEARIKAMRNAIQIANDYATVVGRSVVPVEIRDSAVQFPAAMNAQMYPVMQQQQAQQQQMQMRAAHMQAQTGMAHVAAAITQEGPPFQPGSITATSKINVQFVSTDD